MFPLAAGAQAAVYDPSTRSLVAVSAGAPDRATVTVLAPGGAATPIGLAGGATAMTADGPGRVAVSTRGGYFLVDVAARRASRVA